MATVSTPDTDTTALKPVKTIPASRVVAQLKRNIRRYELRYEIPTAQMFDEVEQGMMRETVEILKWMQDYHVLELLRPKTPTGGNGSTATASSRRNGSRNITS